MNVLYNIYTNTLYTFIQKPVTNPETGDLIFIAKKKGFFLII